jgi:hypothetical protein
MRALRAARAVDRVSHAAITVAGVLCGALVFFVAIPLALSNPFPSPKTENWAANRASFRVASLIPMSIAVEQEALLEPAPAIPDSEPTLWDFVALPVQQASLGFVQPQIKDPADNIADAPRPPRKAASTMEDVDDYLWEVYQRAPTKRDSTGDFSWKDPAAAKRLRLSMRAYVIGGMDPDFREALYHAGRAMDAAGIQWSMLSAFRDDYRQSLAAGFKASSSNSLHGGKARTGGYGHGQAIDITTASGNNDDVVWRWIDRHGAKYGLCRPMPSADPAHIQPRGGWHRIAIALRETRIGAVAQTQLASAKTKLVKAW